MNGKSNIKTYLDESGNSGKNLLDIKQPFLTLGAVLIDDNKLAEVDKFFSELPTELKNEKGEINNPGASPEVLKGVCFTNILVSDPRVGVLNHFYNKRK